MTILRCTLIFSALLRCALLFAAAPETERVELAPGITLELIHISVGTFTMGSPENEAKRDADEESHSVKITEDFWIGKFPITQNQFACFAQATNYRTEAEKGVSGGSGFDGEKLLQRKDFNWRNPGFAQTAEHPVVLVTVKDAEAFNTWLANKLHRAVTLPTEAQWEYTCRAGTTTRFYNGDDEKNADQIAWFRSNSGNSTHPVGQKTPNAWGVHDLCGNVFEWCKDTYGPYRPGGAIQGTLDKPRNVLRGGSWFKGVEHARSAARYRNDPGSRNADNGFRIVVGLSTAKPATTPPASHASEPAAPAPLPSPSPSPATPPQYLPAPAPPPTSNSFNALDSFTPSSSSDSEILRQLGGQHHIFASSSGPDSFVPLFFILTIGGLIAAVIYWIFKSQSDTSLNANRYSHSKYRSTAPGRSLEHVRPRIVDDGFWFDTTGYNAGDEVLYYFVRNGIRVNRRFIIEPGDNGQFIYMGETPEVLALSTLIAAENAAQESTLHSNSELTTHHSSNLHTSSHHDSSFSSFPSAY